MSKYPQPACSDCPGFPDAVCDGCGKLLCPHHRVAMWPTQDDGRKDYCQPCFEKLSPPS